MLDITSPIPDDLTKIPDLLKKATEIRLAMQKETDAVKAYESALEDKLISGLSVDSPGVFGKLFKAKITTKKVAKVDAANWPRFFGYVQRTGRFDLLQKRLSDKAVMEMVEQGDVPDGVETMTIKSVSITKV